MIKHIFKLIWNRKKSTALLMTEVFLSFLVGPLFEKWGGPARDISGELQPFEGATGHLTTLNDAVFSVIPGAPAYVGIATTFKMKNAKVGVNVDVKGQSAVQGAFLFEG